MTEKTTISERSQLVDAALNLYVGKLQRENAESRTWIKQPNNLISVVAIVISLLSVAYGFRRDYYDSIDKDLQALSNAVSDLSKIDSDMLTASNTDPKRLGSLGLVLNNRRFALLSEADRLIGRLGKRAPHAQLAILGTQYIQVNEYEKATKYFLLLTDQSETPFVRAEGWRSLAVAYEGNEPHDKVRDAFQNAAQLLQDPKDVISLTTVIIIYEQWAGFELGVSNFRAALSYLESALQFATRLPCPTMRPAAVARINGAIQQAATTFKNKDPENAKLAIPTPTAAIGNSGC